MSDIHPAAASGFTAGAEAYAQGRPDYPAALQDWLREDLHLGSGKTALDLGSGTGKFLPLLMETGAFVMAVEPLSAMRAQLITRYPGVEAREGTAEKIPVPDASVDAVTCAQSFHWFANPEALAEISRVLRPGGVLGLIWNVRDESVAWVESLGRIIAPYKGETPRHEGGGWRKLFPAAGFGPLRESRFPHSHRGMPDEVILKRILSISFVAALPEEAQSRIAAEIRSLIADTPDLAGQAEVSFPYETLALSCKKSA